MKKIICLFIVISVLFSGCKDEEPTIQPQAQRTVIVYMAAENRLHYNAKKDLSEMQRSASSIPTGSQLIIFLDDCKTPAIYKLTRNGLSQVKQYNEDFICTRPEEMNKVLKEIYSRFPADSYGLIFWSHGSGWTPGTDIRTAYDPLSFGTDNGQNNPGIDRGEELSVTTLARILENYPQTDFIMFDCCLMQCIEVAYELKDVTRYIIGSPAETPANGAPYDKIMPYLFARPFTPEALIRTYHESYNTNPFGGVLLSAFNTAELPALAQLTSELFTPLCNEQHELDTQGLQHYYAWCGATGFAPEYFDINDVMQRHLDNKAYERWFAQFDKTVISRYASSQWLSALSEFYLMPVVKDPASFGGASIFIPNKKYTPQGWNEHFRNFRWYTDAGWGTTGW